ncbi:MAG: 50S ribosomal protein L10 [Gammaproteobacteria bacterium]|nr:50S ribosomal protein L10 [Gammaproteobacteria bacterium]
MALTLEHKKAVVTEVAEVARGALSAIAAEYRGLSVAEMTNLRINARNAGVYMRVVRNTLARRAFEGTDFSCMNDGLSGPLILAFSREEPGSAARVMRDYAKENDKLVIKLVSFGGKLLEISDVGRLADLPTKDEGISQLMSVMMAPIAKLVRTLAEPQAKLVRTLAAVRDQKQTA